MITFKQFLLESLGTKVDEQQLYNTIYNQLQTKLGGMPVPQDITKFGVTADLNGLTLLMMKVAYKESGFYSATKGDQGYFSKPAAGGGMIPGGSHGLFQLSPVDAQTYNFLGFKGNGSVIANTNGIRAFSLQQLTDPTFNTDLTTSIWADSIKKHGTVANPITVNYGWLKSDQMEKLNRYDGKGLPSQSTGDTLTPGQTQPGTSEADTPPATTEYSNWSEIANNLRSAIKTIVDYGKNF